MVAYLSAEWVAALDQALSGVVAPDGADHLVVQYVVVADPPDGAAAGPDGLVHRPDGSTEGPDGAEQEPGRGATEEVAAYHLDFSSGGVRARAGRAPGADVSFTQYLSTARGVARGERSAQLAVLRGDVRIEGDASLLVAWRRALGTDLSSAMAALAAVTDR